MIIVLLERVCLGSANDICERRLELIIPIEQSVRVHGIDSGEIVVYSLAKNIVYDARRRIVEIESPSGVVF